jgi:hypothetical protein
MQQKAEEQLANGAEMILAKDGTGERFCRNDLRQKVQIILVLVQI